MTFEELVSQFAERIGLENFAPDETGTCQLISEDTIISIINCSEINMVLLNAPVMELPVEDENAVLRKCMEANFMFQKTNGGTLALDTETNLIYLSHYVRLDTLDDLSFYNMVMDFSTALCRLQQENSTAEPVAEEQTDEELPQQDVNDFMRV